jgi:hypothetical protein
MAAKFRKNFSNYPKNYYRSSRKSFWSGLVRIEKITRGKTKSISGTLNYIYLPSRNGIFSGKIQESE